MNGHVQKLEHTLNKLKESGIKYNIEKYLFGKTEMEYLGLWVTRYCIKNLDKIKAINNMTPPNTWKGVCKFIGLVNLYSNM